MRLTYKQIRAADGDWPKWQTGAMVALIVLGGVFEWSGHNPVVAVVGIGLLLAVILPIRERELRRRVATLEARQRAARRQVPEG